MGLVHWTPGKKEKGPTPEEAIQKLKETEKILIKKTGVSRAEDSTGATNSQEAWDQEQER